MTNPPHDIQIRVRTAEEGLWLTVLWNRTVGRFDVIGGDGSWVELEEIEVWKPAPHPAIGIGQPRD